jgi:putative transposase
MFSDMSTSAEEELPRFFHPDAEITVGHNRLPHWDQQGRTYSLTFRLFDSVPAHLMHEHRLAKAAWLKEHPEPWTREVELEYLRTFQGQIERWLDQGHGECLLRRGELAEIVAGALRHFEGERTRLHAWVVMPNHVHALTEVMEGWELSGLLLSWKGFTAVEINQRLSRSGPVWQKGYHDRLIRDWDHFRNVVRYIRRNPAKLRAGEFLCGESELAKRF